MQSSVELRFFFTRRKAMQCAFHVIDVHSGREIGFVICN